MSTLVGFQGHAPGVRIGPPGQADAPMTERAKYQRMWDHDAYRNVAPGEFWAGTFVEQACLQKDDEVIDFGCGTGRGGLMISILSGAKVKMLDFADNCLDPDIANACQNQGDYLTFEQADLTQPIKHTAKYGFCTDVMEHLPPEDVPKVLRHILSAAQHVFFAISTVDDAMGALIGEKLHLTVQPASWWEEQLRDAGATINWRAECDGFCAFYCTNWEELGCVDLPGRINCDVSVVDAQVRENILAGWNQVHPWHKQDREIIVLAGGPSLREHLHTIRKLRDSGAALVTMNGTYKWAVENGLIPSLQIVLDAREFNARFVDPALPDTRYMIASQAHPTTLSKLPRERTWIWHCGINKENEELARERAGYYFPVPGGSTVLLRAIPLLRMLGMHKLHIFGFDSCFLDGAHHAYEQRENDNEPMVNVSCGGRAFTCAPWHVHQAIEFQRLVRFLGDEVDLAVYGNGLIAHMLATASATIEQEN